MRAPHSTATTASGRRRSLDDDAAQALARLRSDCRRVLELEADRTGSWHAMLADRFRRLDDWRRHPPAHLVDAAMTDPALAAMTPSLQRLRAIHEAHEERLVAQRLLRSDDPPRAFARWLDEAYPATAIHGTQLGHLLEARRARSCLVLGCGPLPSTAALLVRHTAMAVTCLDHDREHVTAAAELARRARLPRFEGFIEADLFDYAELGSFDVVFATLQAGVPIDDGAQRRDQLVPHLLRGCRPGSTVLLRSAEGMSRLVYPSIDLEGVDAQHLCTLPAPQPGRSALVVLETPA